ncbi:hypothetical protein PDIG_61110 [Penicillium digitatum PHI26]|uniref:Uncharacterized protein n=2 Tax=Penicillium digitatum TaxID=36651 RepID=K9G8F2_PEND2|nr:hypothetical protein PDIP_70540 [Penicillium digitatum Pd1]EKV08091.1 hypothetical protein PDIP_70540 [Penicillium digitatum Pd1]EKV09501.1 hypothetical protein PDIG_61110 [Penicillium digitatum PHI26]
MIHMLCAKLITRLDSHDGSSKSLDRGLGRPMSLILPRSK